jgi:hypothetical protein
LDGAVTEREKDAAAVALGRKGGQAKTEDKAKAARENILKAIAARWKDHTPSPNRNKRKAKAPK